LDKNVIIRQSLRRYSRNIVRNIDEVRYEKHQSEWMAFISVESVMLHVLSHSPRICVGRHDEPKHSD
jgi:hypothetical protein